MVQNILTVDVEEWESAISGIFGEYKPSTEKVYKSTMELLEIFNKFNAEATFFVLGEVAEKFPSLLKNILNSGNAIACHSYTHIEIHKLSLNKLIDDIKKAKDIVEQIIGERIIGFRAPNFSLMKANPEILNLLLELGFKYDSSIFPYKKFNGRKVPLEPFWLGTPDGKRIFEIPLSVISIFGIRIPCCGGAFIRNYPFVFTKYCFKKILKEKRSVVFYFHPHEFEKINFKNINLNIGYLRKLLEKKGRGKAKGYLEFILKNFNFVSIERAFSNQLIGQLI